MDLAYVISQRGTCTRRKVGAVIIDPLTRAVISTGYNGSLPSAPHCEDVGCFMQSGHCITTIHAETNAINQAARNGLNVDGAEIYCTSKPCWNCFKNIIQSGITRIYYSEDYDTSSIPLYSEFLLNNSHILMEKI